MRSAVPVGMLLLLLLLLAPAVRAAGAGAEPSLGLGPRGVFLEAERLEAEGALRQAAERFARVAEKTPGDAEACWRAARSYWRDAELASLSGLDGARKEFEAAERWARQGLERDPECGACALWLHAAMGRMVEYRGFLWAARHARQLRKLLERGLALQPGHLDPNGNSTLANLHYASAVFLRMLPEWFWLGLVVGARGDLDRSLSHIRRALEISPERVDYAVEYGAILLCIGQRHHEPGRTRQGRAVLTRALQMASVLETDPVDQRYAREMIDEPEQACGFSRMGYIDVEGQGQKLAGRLK